MKVLIFLFLLWEVWSELMIRCDFTVSKRLMTLEEYRSKQLFEEDHHRQKKALETMKKLASHQNMGAFKLAPDAEGFEEPKRNQLAKPETESEVVPEAELANNADNQSDEGDALDEEKKSSAAITQNEENHSSETELSETENASTGDAQSSTLENSSLENDSSSGESEETADEKEAILRLARKTKGVSADSGINASISFKRPNYEFGRRYVEGEMPSKVKKVNYSMSPDIRGRVLQSNADRFLKRVNQKSLYFDIHMKCEYISEDNSSNLRYKSKTKLTCDSNQAATMNFIMVGPIISNKETINLQKMMRYKQTDKGHYISYVADKDFYPKIQTIPEKCSFIIESGVRLSKSIGLLIAFVLFLVN
jgi:hypothetical protein